MSKTEIECKVKDLENCEKKKIERKASWKFKKVYWIPIGSVVIIFIPLLLYTPAGFKTPGAVYSREVSNYLTHQLSPQLYNGAQLQEPFDLVVRQEGINEIISHSRWPKDVDGIKFLRPKVLFVPGRIVLMGAVVIKGVELVATVFTEPRLNEQGLLNLHVKRVRIGAVNMTLLARVIAARMYEQQVATKNTDGHSLRAKIAASLLNNEPFEPVFDIPGDGKRVQIEKITIEDEKLTLGLVSVSD